jgi:hypothetical protein
MVNREVARILNRLTELLPLRRRNTPNRIVYEDQRLESHFFGGYDPHFEGDEPPDL